MPLVTEDDVRTMLANLTEDLKTLDRAHVKARICASQQTAVDLADLTTPAGAAE